MEEEYAFTDADKKLVRLMKERMAESTAGWIAALAIASGMTEEVNAFIGENPNCKDKDIVEFVLERLPDEYAADDDNVEEELT